MLLQFFCFQKRYNSKTGGIYLNFIAFIFCVLGIVFFMVGMHGIDNAWNLPLNWYDQNLLGHPFTRDQLYSQSIIVVFLGFLLTVFSIPHLSRSNRKVTKQQLEEFTQDRNPL